MAGIQKADEKDKEPKICPILMAGAMIYEIHTQTDHTTRHKVYHDSVLCLGDKCEWFDNGCPAHPRLDPKFVLRRDELLVKFKANEISRSEAIELNDILVKEQRNAQKRGDNSASVVIGLVLALLASRL